VLLLDLVSLLSSFLAIISPNKVEVLRAYQFVFNTNEEQSSVSFGYNLYATIFDEAEFEVARESIDPKLFELGVRLTQQKSSDIYLPSVSSQELSVE
jgi:hypothetical protein